MFFDEYIHKTHQMYDWMTGQDIVGDRQSMRGLLSHNINDDKLIINDWVFECNFQR